jgi:hypothetical protein
MYGYCADPSVGAIGCAVATPRCESGAVRNSVPPDAPSLMPRWVSRTCDRLFACDAADAADAAPNRAAIAANFIQWIDPENMSVPS